MRLILPAIAGVVLGMMITGNVEMPASVSDAPVSSGSIREAALPEDPAIIRIAALAGRTNEVRKKIGDLLAAGAKDDEIAEWLALILFSDPAWLDTFILTVPEDRRIALTRLTIMKVGKLQADAAWELIRSSPYARSAARSAVEVEKRKGLDILGYCMASPLAAETMLDPSLGFTEEEINGNLRWTRGKENARRILDEWMRGRWKGEPPGFVSSAWAHFWSSDKQALQEIGKTLPEELRVFTERFNALNEQEQRVRESRAIPGVEDLSKLGHRELMQTFEDQWISGTRIPMETLTQLPAELRKAGIENYFKQDDSFHPDMAQKCVDQMDQLDLTPSEKQSLLKGAATSVWVNQGDYQTALDWAARIPDASGRAEFEQKILTELAQQDPDAALEYIATLPDGDLRRKIKHIATEALP